jgi:hypothetical protein
VASRAAVILSAAKDLHLPEKAKCRSFALLRMTVPSWRELFLIPDP